MGLRLLAIYLLLLIPVLALAEVAVPPFRSFLSDTTGTLSGADLQQIEATLKAFEQRKGAQLAVLIIPSTENESIEQYALRVAENWKLGRKGIDDGVLLVVAKNDRALRIEVGYGLEGSLSDAITKRIIDEIIVPKFRDGDFSAGIREGVARIIGVIDGEKLPAPPEASLGYNPDNEGIFGIIIFIGFSLSGLLAQKIGVIPTGLLFGSVAGSVGTFYFPPHVALLIGLGVSLLMMLVAFGNKGGSRGSSRSSSSGGYRSSSSSSSFSGGGGGSFGGGGSSGRW